MSDVTTATDPNAEGAGITRPAHLDLPQRVPAADPLFARVDAPRSEGGEAQRQGGALGEARADAQHKQELDRLPPGLREVVRKAEEKLQRELAASSRTEQEKVHALETAYQKTRALSNEWEQMQKHLSAETLAYIEGRSPETIRQLLEMKIYTRINVERLDVQAQHDTLERYTQTIERWRKLQGIVDENPGMGARMERLKAQDVQDLLNGTLQVENLLDRRDKHTDQLLEARDIERLLPVALSEAELRRVEVMGDKLGQHIHTLEQSPLLAEQELGLRMERQVEAMDPGVYYNMLLGRIPPYELRIAIAAEAEGVTWELVKATYLTEADTRLILRGEALQQWEAAQAEWHRVVEARKPELEREWHGLMDHFYGNRLKTYERLAQLPEEVRYHLLSINVSSYHLLDQLRPNLQQVITMLHPDDLYPFLQQRVDKNIPSFGANADWLRFQEIVHNLHEGLETGKTQCVGTDFFTGLPLYPPRRYSFFTFGTPGGGKTDNVVLINLVQHQSSKEALIVIDPKGDSTSFVKDRLGKDNLGELTGIAAGAVGKDHRVVIVGPGTDELGVNILWYIPTTAALTERVQQLERQIGRLDHHAIGFDDPARVLPMRDGLNRELTELRSDLTLLERKQHQMAVKIGAAWAKASVDAQDLESMSHTYPGIRDLYLQTIAAAMLYLRLESPGLPALSQLRFIATEEGLQRLAGDHAPQFARDTYTSIKALGPDQRAALQSLLVSSTSVLNDPIVQRFTNTNGVDIEAVLRPEAGQNPWAVFVNMHLNLNDEQLLAPVYESLFETWHEAIKYVKVHSPEVHSNNIFMVMDEAKNIATRSSNGGIHPNLNEIIDVMRSSGYRGLFSTQSPDVVAPDLLSKATLIAVTPDDLTAQYLADKMGITTRQLDTQSRSSQNMVAQAQGTKTPSFGFGFTREESTQWRDVLQLTQGTTAREVPLVYPHNLTQLPRSLGIMVVPSNAPALFEPINPKRSVVIKAMRRLEPTVLHEPVKDSQTFADMAEQLTGVQVRPSAGMPSSASGPDASEIDPGREITQIEELRRFYEGQGAQGHIQPQRLDEIRQELIGEIEALNLIRQDIERQRRQAQGDSVA